ncbi:MAG TPA: alcohol dehydrogenase catalytic domain-containing protein [Nocardioidaceae bacterium]|nr:alcohol dehydrogenase catalytic domain-containing protein [Nocardioidaceae bacterium]
MRALQLVAPHVIEIRDVAVPAIGPDEILVKVAGAGLCHSDLHLRHLENFPWGRPMTLGHETSGHVVGIGDAVEGFNTGAPVLVSLVWSCGRCRPCVEGRDNVCVTAAGRTRYPVTPGVGPDGGMAEYIKVKARFLEPLGDLDPITSAPLADAALTPMHAINGARHRLGPGATVGLIGLGGLGQMALQILAATTSARLVAIDTDPDKLEVARTFGAIALSSNEAAVAAVLDLTDGYGADAVFDFVGLQPTVDLACQVIAPDGALRLVGLGGGRFSFAADSSTRTLPWGVDVRRSYGGTRSDQRQVLDLAATGRISVPSCIYPLDDALTAFADLEAGRVAGRAILVP